MGLSSQFSGKVVLFEYQSIYIIQVGIRICVSSSLRADVIYRAIRESFGLVQFSALKYTLGIVSGTVVQV
jgi:hypothetical protein